MPLAGKPTSYVSLYRTGLDQNGEKDWEQCEDDEGLLVGSDEIERFVIGVPACTVKL